MDIFPQGGELRRLGNLCYYIYSRNKHIDLFPRTSAVEKMAILGVKKAIDKFPRTNGLICRNFDINREQSSHVECAVMMQYCGKEKKK